MENYRITNDTIDRRAYLKICIGSAKFKKERRNMNKKSEKAVNDAIQGLAWEVENLASDEAEKAPVFADAIKTMQDALQSSAYERGSMGAQRSRNEGTY